jgi:translocation and assembly module TamB
VKGTPQNLGLTADLVGDAGRLEVDGTFDMSWPSYRATARGSATGLDLSRFLGRDDMPTTNIALRWSSDIEGDSLADMRGSASVRLDRSLVDSVRIFGGDLRVRFLAGTMAVDSLRVESAAFTATARGRLALASGRVGDSVAFRLQFDSLGGFRRAMTRLSGNSAVERAVSDTSALDGELRIDGSVGGAWPAVRIDAAARGTNVRVGTTRVRDVDASARLTLPIDSLRGTVRARLEGLTAGAVRLNAVTASIDVPAPQRASAELRAEFANGPFASAHADVAWTRDTTDVRLDRLRIALTDNDWALLTPARLLHGRVGWTVDSLVLVGRAAGRLSLRGAFPDSESVAARLDASDVPLADAGELLQTSAPLRGSLRLSASLTGTRDAPEITLDAGLRDAVMAGMNLESADATGRYANRQLTASLRTLRGTATALHLDATLPVDLSLRSVSRRLLDDLPLRARLQSDSAGVAILETLTPEVKRAEGTLALDVTVGGTFKAPTATGALRVTGGGFDVLGLGTTWREVNIDIGFLGDSIALRNVSARSGPARNSRASLTGWLGLHDINDPRFDFRLAAQNFNVINKARVADLDLSGEMRVAGAKSGSTLTGSLTVDRGTIYIPDISKELISLEDVEMIDTSALSDHGILPRTPSRVVENLVVSDMPVTMGRDVTLRSAEANIKLGGAVTITTARVQRGRNVGRYQLALTGALQTVRGSYRLRVGPVQRTFDVEGGEVRFRGDADPNLAELDIRALHTVRTFSRTPRGRMCASA